MNAPVPVFWKPGDPCANCGSTRTHYSVVWGAWCANCQATDADENL